MAAVSFQVIEGMEAGRVFRDLHTPITIGREEDNDVQLNDERISRFHAKIQDDSGRLILTDLESTNGTRVNGHPVKVRVLRLGDQISVGRCLIVVGSPEELALPITFDEDDSASDLTSAPHQTLEQPDSPPAFPHGPPPVPRRLNALQTAELSDILEYARTEALAVLKETFDSEDMNEELVCLPRTAWHRLQQLPAQLSRYLSELADPPQD